MDGKISTIINTYNEAHLLKDCINSIKYFSDEIIVGDMMSTDESFELAEKLGCKVIRYPHKEIVEETILQRLKYTSFNWILLFDVDMILPIQTAARLKEIVENDEADVVEFYYKIRIFGNYIKHGHDSGGYHVRSFKKSVLFLGGEPKVKIHSMLIDPLKKNTSRWLRLERKYYIEHMAYDELISVCSNILNMLGLKLKKGF